MQLAIFTHVEHTKRKGLYYAYAPYVREMNLWLKHVKEVEIVAPVKTKCREEMRVLERGKEEKRRAEEQGLAYEYAEVNFTEVPSFNFNNLFSSVKALIKIPFIFVKILGAMQRADHLHLRCPGNIGLITAVAQIFFPNKSKSAKYAGNWDPEAEQPKSYKLQKWILRNSFLTRNMQVLVYGKWPKQTKNIKPFFTASFSEEEKSEVGEKDFSRSFIALFVGNLVKGKRPLEAIKLVEKLNLELKWNMSGDMRDNSDRAKLEIYGDGPEKEKLQIYVREKQLEQFIIFKGSRSLEELKQAYQKAHFVVLPSESEGWPKAIAEGMFFGCIPIATGVSCVPWMLNYGSRGILLDEYRNQEPRAKNLDFLSMNINKIELLLKDPEEMKRMSEEAKKWSQQYTLEKFEAAIKKVLIHPNKEKNVFKRNFSPASFKE